MKCSECIKLNLFWWLSQSKLVGNFKCKGRNWLKIARGSEFIIARIRIEQQKLLFRIHAGWSWKMKLINIITRTVSMKITAGK